MAKGQKKSNKEVRKPKAGKAAAAPAPLFANAGTMPASSKKPRKTKDAE